MNQQRSSLAQLTTATILFAFVGIWAKLLVLDNNPVQNAIEFTFGRSLFAAVALGLLFSLGKTERGAPLRPNRYGVVLAIGAANALNWLFYVLAINVSTVSIAVISLFTYPLITSLIEPFVFKESHRPAELIGGCAVLAGVVLITPEFSLGNQDTLGVIFGLLAAASFAARNILSRGVVGELGSTKLMSFVFVIAALGYAPFGAAAAPQWNLVDWGMLAVLGIVLTAGGQTLFVNSLKNVTSSWASLVVSVQPVITVGLAFWLLDERVDTRTLIGGLVLISSVVYATWPRKKSGAD